LKQLLYYRFLLPDSPLMPLNRIAYHASPISRTGIRMTSTIVGKSGRVYIQREVLRERKDPRLSILKAGYVVQISHLGLRLTKVVLDLMTSLSSKCVSKLFYDLSLRLAANFPKSRQLRMHADFNEDENVLIYLYY
jgi:hypothetical protein